MNYLPRVYVHAPYSPDAERAVVKSAVLDLVRSEGFDLQEFNVSGLPRGDTWTFQRAIDVMRQCDGAIVLALARWMTDDLPIPSEYSHFEGALALASGLPTLILAETKMEKRGILLEVGGSFVVRIPMDDSPAWIRERRLLQAPPAQEWLARIRSRYDVFFGYCSKSSQLAHEIRTFLEEDGLRVLDWATSFRAGRTIMDEVKRAAATSRCGLFLFTADDPIEGSREAIPRDNVLLEAGYFMSAASPSRTVVVREAGTKMPADLGGIIYLTIDERSEWKLTAREIAAAIRTQMTEDAA